MEINVNIRKGKKLSILKIGEGGVATHGSVLTWLVVGKQWWA